MLIAIDRSEYSEIVVEHGLDHAVELGADELHFMTVVETDAEIAGARSWLDATSREAAETFGCADRQRVVHVRRGQPVPEIVRLAGELAPDVLVIGRFGVPSISDEVLALVDVPTLVVGLEGPVLEPQCPACRRVRRESNGERLFCDAHAGGDLRELATRLPPSSQIGSRLW